MENCNSDANLFCYVCGKFVAARLRQKFTNSFEEGYRLYFGREIIKNVRWAPNKCCPTCYRGLLYWLSGKRQSLPFGVPMIWSEPEEHDAQQCYFCLYKVFGHSMKTREKVVLRSQPHAITPQAHSEDIPVPPLPDSQSEYSSNVESELSEFNANLEEVDCSEFVPSCYESVDHPELLTQQRFNDLVRDFRISIYDSEVLASRFKEWNLLQPDVRITVQRNRYEKFKEFFTEELMNYAFCDDVNNLMKALDIKYVAIDWRLFIDSSATSLKAVLLHNGNIINSIPIAYCTQTKENYDTMETLLRDINYEEHQWNLCCDLKVVALLQGLQLGHTKFSCFLCEWDNRAKINQYERKEWPPRNEPSTSRGKNFVADRLVPKEKIFLPPLHIKLGIVKNFIKAMEKTGEGFQYLRRVFPNLTPAKMNEGKILRIDKKKSNYYTAVFCFVFFFIYLF